MIPTSTIIWSGISKVTQFIILSSKHHWYGTTSYDLSLSVPIGLINVGVSGQKFFPSIMEKKKNFALPCFAMTPIRGVAVFVTLALVGLCSFLSLTKTQSAYPTSSAAFQTLASPLVCPACHCNVTCNMPNWAPNASPTPGEAGETTPHQAPISASDPKNMDCKLSTAIRYPAMVKTVEREPPDATMTLVNKTEHLKTSFYVANPWSPNGIVQYVTKHPGEKAVTEVFHHIIRKTKCEGLMLDVGSNTGFYSMLSLSQGCRNVYLFDPQPKCIYHMTHAMVKNKFEEATIIPHLVDSVSGREIDLDITAGCGGSWPVTQFIKGAPEPENIRKIKSVTLTEVIPEGARISHAKVDTEGAESLVLSSMMPLIKKGQVDSVIFGKFSHLCSTKHVVPIDVHILSLFFSNSLYV